MTSQTLLVIEDDAKMRRVLEIILSQDGYRIYAAAGGEEGLQILEEKNCDLVLTDLQMQKIDGIQVLEQVKKRHPHIPVLIITAYGTVKTAVEAMHRGAWDYITKPIDNEELKLVIRRALDLQKITLENKTLSQGLKQKFGFDRIIGDSEPIIQVTKLAQEVAQTDSTVLITGESGTGKELFARAIHYASKRSRAPLVTINCAAIPETLLESELFGYQKGAFTDAKTSKPGKFLMANRGTIFLDEISEMSLGTQVKLLRVLQEKEIEPLGSTQTTSLDIRVVAATNKDLLQMIQQGTFREDLFYRLNVFPISLASLRDRKGDIRLLTAYFVEGFNRAMGKRFKGFSEGSLKKLEGYSWRGNVRELQNIVERVLITCKKETVEPEDFPIRLEENLPLQKEVPPLLSLGLSLDDIEKRVIQEALSKTLGNISDASKLLGITRSTLRYRIQKFQIQE
jgi:DNA-binding NtrC family response regulator